LKWSDLPKAWGKQGEGRAAFAALIQYSRVERGVVSSGKRWRFLVLLVRWMRARRRTERRESG
jgi:hypothetical protein